MSSECPLTQQVKETLERYSMLPHGASVLIGLSGGADSMTLLSVLCELREQYHWTLLAAHINHGIRGEEADRDEVFCRTVCAAFDVPLEVRHVDVPTLARETGESLELCGRKVRYECFQELLATLSEPAYVATAHTASDAAETLLFHLVRGSGRNGLTGIPPVRDRIVRPLIDCTREEIEAYCADRGLSYVEDSTNSDLGYARNRIRHNVLPELEALNSGAVANLNRCMELLRRDEDYLARQAEALVIQADQQSAVPGQYDASVFADADPAVSSRALLSILTDACGVVPEQRHIDALLDLLPDGGQIQIPSGAYVTVQNGLLSCRLADEDVRTPTELFLTPVSRAQLDEQGWDTPFLIVPLPFGTFRLEVRPNPRAGKPWNIVDGEGPNKVPEELLENALDYDKILSTFAVRNRRPGDRFRPPRRGVSKPVKQLFAEASLPPEERGSVVFLETEGTVAWIEGFGPAEGFEPTADTQKLLVCSIERTPRDLNL